ncbi:hypothetical protein B0J12DRAFT_349886 [Macrophomina phaseolina]|uniref:Uncharacterized protein n=1 Tax=Macrophomina phaseolina TaxID=35725 RepID=A0ABQ8FUM9_9PEZI|nr:hypothetical protein B0J12DRAFT_349886 [Macrophomina phaseolina]
MHIRAVLLLAAASGICSTNAAAIPRNKRSAAAPAAADGAHASLLKSLDAFAAAIPSKRAADSADSRAQLEEALNRLGAAGTPVKRATDEEEQADSHAELANVLNSLGSSKPAKRATADEEQADSHAELAKVLNSLGSDGTPTKRATDDEEQEDSHAELAKVLNTLGSDAPQ